MPDSSSGPPPYEKAAADVTSEGRFAQYVPTRRSLLTVHSQGESVVTTERGLDPAPHLFWPPGCEAGGLCRCLSPQPSCVSCQPLPVALSDRSASALHCSRSSNISRTVALIAC